MSITLRFLAETTTTLYFELPETVFYQGKTVNEFKMSSPAGLIRALNANNQNLHELFENKNEFNAFWETAKICRKKIVVKKHSSEEILHLKKEAKILRKEEKSWRLCAICGVKCKRSKQNIGTCSETCRNVKLVQRNELVKKAHWCNSENYEQIRDKRIATRKNNDKILNRVYVPWNKDKTGIYSLETIEKIRNASRNQFHKELIRKTSIEQKIENFLKEINANYKYSFILAQRQYDFLLKESKAVIEVHGDFWHGNPAFWGGDKKPLRDHQVMKQLDDKIKERLAKENGYKYFFFWEHDINNNWEFCAEKIREIANGSY